MPSLDARVGIKNAGFQSGLSQMRSQARSAANDIKGYFVGALAGGAVLGFFKNLFDEMGRVQDLSERFKTSAESIQRVGESAKLAGADIELVAKSISRLTIEAQKGGETAEIMVRLGISTQAFLGMDLEGKVIALAGAHERASGSIEDSAAFMELLGGRGQDLLPLLSQGAEALAEQFRSVKVATDDTVAAIDQAGDTLTEFGNKVKVISANVIGAFMNMGKASADLAKAQGQGTFLEDTAKELIAAEKSGDAERIKKARAMAKFATGIGTEEKPAAGATGETKDKETKGPMFGPGNDAGAREAFAAQEREREKAMSEKERADEKAKRDAEEKAKDLSDAQADRKKAARDLAFSRADTPEAQRDFLRKEKEATLAQAKKLRASGDETGALGKESAADQLQQQIESILDPQKQKRGPASVSVSSLQAIGGGAGIGAGTDPTTREIQRGNSLLERIANAIEGGAGLRGDKLQPEPPAY